MNLQERAEIVRGEGLKTLAEIALQKAGQATLGQLALEVYGGGPHGRFESPRLAVNVAGVGFDNPLIVGAGWDKYGRALRGLYHLGFAGVEVGTVTPRPQPGNSKPRLWTVDRHHSVGLNRMGFNSPGKEVVQENLEQTWPVEFHVGVNVGRNKDADNAQAAEAHAEVIAALGKYASYITLGISSPNTPGLRELQSPQYLEHLLVSAREAMRFPVPLFAKIDGDRPDKEIVAGAALLAELGYDGVVAINTSTNENWKGKYGAQWAKEPGGLSGADLDYRDRATEVIRMIYRETGEHLAIMGVGGISTAEHALDKLCAGASALQIVTAIRSSWGKVAGQINRELDQRLEAAGIANIQQIIGSRAVSGMRSSDSW
jgi:dihydroorotate dehydrogenase